MDLRGLPPQTEANVATLGKVAAFVRESHRRPGVDLFKVAREQALEGIVAELATGRYEPEKTTWVKIKNPAYSQAEGREEFFELR